MDEALDEVATTFKGIVLYGACTNLGVYDINVTGGVNYNEGWRDTDSAPHLAVSCFAHAGECLKVRHFRSVRATKRGATIHRS